MVIQKSLARRAADMRGRARLGTCKADDRGSNEVPVCRLVFPLVTAVMKDPSATEMGTSTLCLLVKESADGNKWAEAPLSSIGEGE